MTKKISEEQETILNLKNITQTQQNLKKIALTYNKTNIKKKDRAKNYFKKRPWPN